jgi:hypothetical protein
MGASAACALALATGASSALATPTVPTISKEAIAEVTETSASLKGTINPGEKQTEYRFEYVDQATFEAEGFATATSVPVPNGIIPEGTEDIAVQAPIEGLKPGTLYRFHLFAKNSKGKVTGPDSNFATFAPSPVFGVCPANEAFRSGDLSPLSHPSTELPDCRAFEQASPVDKNGGDAAGIPGLVKAAPEGNAISFTATSGVPGGDGAQKIPNYVAMRGAAGEWSTHGLLPPASAGGKAKLLGWQPDFSQVFTRATTLGQLPVEAFFSRPGGGGALTQITPQVPELGFGAYDFSGTSKDGSKVVFESPVDLGTAPAGIDGPPNVYAWDRSSGTLRLASVMNDEQSLAKGGMAGPYDWVHGTNSVTLGAAAAVRSYYLQDEHAVSEEGSVYFTAAGTGKLYLRENPTEPQSAMSGEECTEAQKACTIEVSATHRTAPDPAGTRPAAFMAATADGSKAFFTSSEELTDDANAGPVQPPSQIGRAKVGAGPAEDEKLGFLPAHALGLATSPDGKFIYWSDPITHFIGRAELSGEGVANKEPEYIDTKETSFESHPESKPGVLESAPSAPRHVAVDSKYVYWTNTGPLGEAGVEGVDRPVDGAGTIGRAEIGPTEGEEVEPEFIKGASNPQGIAVNASHIYWANAAVKDHLKRSISRAETNGNGVEPEFFKLKEPGFAPYGVALSGSHIYVTADVEASTDFGYVVRATLEGTESTELFVGEAGMRGVAVDGSNLYWANQGEAAIGRVPLADFKPGACIFISTCGTEFIEPTGTLEGLATAGEHLFWSVNGETPPNPGNDLYRFEANSGALTDLTPDAGDENGAEVKGVLGTSADGSYVYFVANGDLDGLGGEATPGDCHGVELSDLSGSCNLYLWHEGEPIKFIARLKTGGDSDAADWAGTPRGSFSSYEPKTAFASPDGRTLVFRSLQKLTAYENAGVPEYYRYRVGEPFLCVTCNPTGEAPARRPTLGTIHSPGELSPTNPAALTSRNLSADGDRFFFETTEALVSSDTDSAESCPETLAGVACKDVYEWEAPGSGSCKEGGPGYAPLDDGCLYLLSVGKEHEPAYFADASESGDDAFIFTRSQLVGQDTDGLMDVYDVHVDGGLASQNEAPKVPCEGEACKPATTPAPQVDSPPNFSGPPNPTHKRPGACPKGKRRVKSRCVKPHKGRHKRHASHNRGGAK